MKTAAEIVAYLNANPEIAVEVAAAIGGRFVGPWERYESDEYLRYVRRGVRHVEIIVTATEGKEASPIGPYVGWWNTSPVDGKSGQRGTNAEARDEADRHLAALGIVAVGDEIVGGR